MTPKITDEMRAALRQQPGKPVEVVDDQNATTYLLVDANQGRALTEQWIRDALQIGLEAAQRGEIQKFDPDSICSAARAQIGTGN